MKPVIFALAGMSECGKSTAGRHFQSVGVERLKIVRFMNEVKAADGAADEEYGQWINRVRRERPEWHAEQFTDRLLRYIQQAGRSAVSIESLYDPILAGSMKQRLGEQFVVLFIDIPREVQVDPG